MYDVAMPYEHSLDLSADARKKVAMKIEELTLADPSLNVNLRPDGEESALVMVEKSSGRIPDRILPKDPDVICRYLEEVGR